jgi:5-methylcytosine-specific restriction endonuclease McrA
MTIMKRCNKCGLEFVASNEFFHKDSSRKDGLALKCKACCKVARRNWYIDNRDHAIEYSKQWAIDNYEHVLAQHREWNKLNPEKKKQSNANWKANNRGVYLTSRQRRYEKDADNRRSKSKEWRDQHPEMVRIQWKTRQSRERASVGDHSPNDIRVLYEDQCGQCAYCGIRLFDSFHVDHVIPISKGGSNWPDNLALTCEYCNLSKKDKLLAEWQAIRGW